MIQRPDHIISLGCFTQKIGLLFFTKRPVVAIDNDDASIDEEGGAGGKENWVDAELWMTF